MPPFPHTHTACSLSKSPHHVPDLWEMHRAFSVGPKGQVPTNPKVKELTPACPHAYRI